MKPYTLEDAENEIASIYRWFSQEAPGVVVQEEGHLAALWSVADSFYAEEES